MANDFDYLHIKGRTEGSSNELSFDVLDAARSELDSGKKSRGRHARRDKKSGRRSRGKQASVATSSKAAETSKGAKASLSSAAERGSGATATSSRRTSRRTATSSAPLVSASEVARRKRERRSHTVRRLAIGALVAVAVIGVGVFFGYRFYQERADFNGRFLGLIDRVVEVDQSLVKVDLIMKDPLADGTTESRTEALAEIPDLQQRLARIGEDTEALVQSTGGDVDAVALGQLTSAVETRQDMLDIAEDALRQALEVSTQVAKADKAWDEVLDADQVARNAATMASKASTEAETTAARDKTNEALDAMNSALAVIEDLEKDNKGIDLRAYEAYVQKRVKALEYAVATAEALLANDRQAATKANDSYNETEIEAAELAEDLPDSLGAAVEQFYQDEMDEYATEYASARERVTSIDSDLRTHL